MDNVRYGASGRLTRDLKRSYQVEFFDKENKFAYGLKYAIPKNIVLTANYRSVKNNSKNDINIQSVLKIIDENINVILFADLSHQDKDILIKKYKSLGLDGFTDQDYSVTSLLK